jgi:hypothetical protein
MDPVAARTLLKAKTLPPPQTDWLAWGAIIHRRLQSADESGDACELLAHVLWYHPSDHDDRARLSALQVAEAILALSSSFTKDRTEGAVVGGLRYGFVAPEEDVLIIWAAPGDAVSLRSRMLQAYDRFVLFRAPLNELIDFDGARALARRRKTRRKSRDDDFGEDGDDHDQVDDVREMLEAHFAAPRTPGFAPLADASIGDASLSSAARNEVARLASTTTAVDGVSACLVLVNGRVAATTLEDVKVLAPALRDAGEAIVRKGRAGDGSWAGAGAGFATPELSLAACGTNARFRCVGGGERNVDDLGPGDAVERVWCPAVRPAPAVGRVRCAYDAGIGTADEHRRLLVFYAARSAVLVGILIDDAAVRASDAGLSRRWATAVCQRVGDAIQAELCDPDRQWDLAPVPPSLPPAGVRVCAFEGAAPRTAAPFRAPAAARSLIAESHAALVASPEAREEVFVFPSDQSCVVSASDGGARRAYAWLDGRAASLRECAERVDRLRGGEGFL